ncbi:hypothetical protein FRB97_001091 [Tulasnella sp. 331]|nr:hypothetical protein FRB97_001091 [Tulasnella sp. 331]
MTEYYELSFLAPTIEFQHSSEPSSSDMPTYYNKGSRTLALSGLVLTLTMGIVFIIVGLVIFFIAPKFVNETIANERGWDPAVEHNVAFLMGETASLTLSLILSFVVTACTEATGFVHGTTLKWGLAEEDRFTFNATLRLLQATSGIFSPNCWPTNALFAFSLILSYAASSTMILRDEIWVGNVVSGSGEWYGVSVISFVPPILLGGAFLIQALLGLRALRSTQVSTWSSSPLDMTSALIHHGYIRHSPDRCMLSVTDADTQTGDAVRPSPLHPSPSAAHPSIRRVVGLLWTLAVAPLLVYVIMNHIGHGRTLSILRWKGGGGPSKGRGAPPADVLWGTLLIGGIQSILTIGLHCSELVVTLARDEGLWREASGPWGARPAGNPLTVAFSSWQSLVLLLIKPVSHWLYGQAVNLTVGEGVEVWPIFLLFLSGGMIFVATFITFVATRQATGPQPVAYGHAQTLANLVDKWSPTMYWGHKSEGPIVWPICHAEAVLGPVKGLQDTRLDIHNRQKPTFHPPDLDALYPTMGKKKNPYGMGAGADLSKGGPSLADMSNWIYRMIGDPQAHGLDHAPDLVWTHTQRTAVFVPIGVQDRDESKVHYVLGGHFWRGFCDITKGHVLRKLGGELGVQRESTVYIATIQSEDAISSMQWRSVTLLPKIESYPDFLSSAYPSPVLPLHPTTHNRGFGRPLPLYSSISQEEKHQDGQPSVSLITHSLEAKPEQKLELKPTDEQMLGVMASPVVARPNWPAIPVKTGIGGVNEEKKPTDRELEQVVVPPILPRKAQEGRGLKTEPGSALPMEEETKPTDKELEGFVVLPISSSNSRPTEVKRQLEARTRVKQEESLPPPVAHNGRSSSSSSSSSQMVSVDAKRDPGLLPNQPEGYGVPPKTMPYSRSGFPVKTEHSMPPDVLDADGWPRHAKRKTQERTDTLNVKRFKNGE